MYSVDTSSFMDWQARYYPPDVFISLEQRIEALIGEEPFRPRRVPGSGRAVHQPARADAAGEVGALTAVAYSAAVR
jgi:hypothetical protein